MVFRRLALQLTEKGLSAPNPTVTLALAAGKVAKGKDQFPALAKERGFVWFGPDWIVERLEELSTTGYDNEVASVVSKLLLDQQRA